MNIQTICQLQDIPLCEAERALASLQEKGLISGFVPGDANADIRLTSAAEPYTRQYIMETK